MPRPTTNSAGPDPEDDRRKGLEEELGRIVHGWRWEYADTPELLRGDLTQRDEFERQIEELRQSVRQTAITRRDIMRRQRTEEDRRRSNQQVRRDMKSMITITVLPQENDRFVCKVASSFAECTNYGETEQEAISNALDSYSRTIRNWRPAEGEDQ